MVEYKFCDTMYTQAIYDMHIDTFGAASVFICPVS